MLLACGQADSQGNRALHIHIRKCSISNQMDIMRDIPSSDSQSIEQSDGAHWTHSMLRSLPRGPENQLCGRSHVHRTSCNCAGSSPRS